MSVKINDLMVKNVITTRPHETAGHVKAVLSRNRISAIPVEGPDGEPVGIVTTRDLIETGHGTPVSEIMSSPVVTLPAYSDIADAARAMRRRHIHHLIVTHEKQIVGILSSFDLLRLVEEHHFEAKDRPTRPGRPRSIQDRRQGRMRRGHPGRD